MRTSTIVTIEPVLAGQCWAEAGVGAGLFEPLADAEVLRLAPPGDEADPWGGWSRSMRRVRW